MPLTNVLSPLAIALAHKPLSEPGALVISAPTSPAARSLLSGVIPSQLFQTAVRDAQNASAVLAGLWLGHEALDEAHRLAQDIASPTGSFWHAIVHRREGDFSNAKYWYARCRTHEVNKSLAALAASAAGDAADDRLIRRLTSGNWEGSALADLVESVHGNARDARYAAALRFQQIEWQTLFEHCARLATGQPAK